MAEGLPSQPPRSSRQIKRAKSRYDEPSKEAGILLKMGIFHIMP